MKLTLCADSYHGDFFGESRSFKVLFFAKLELNKSMRTRKILNEITHFYEFLPEILISPKNFT